MKIPRLALAGFVIAMFGAFLSFCWDAVFNFILSKAMQLTPNSTLYKSWKDPELPMYTEIYLFNWTNPEQLFKEDFIPNLVEMGPYTFRSQVGIVNITWHANKTVSFRRRRFWYFEPIRTKGSLSENVTTINPVALTAAHVTRYSNFLMQLSLTTALKLTRQKLWITKTVGEFLFDGYEDPLITIANTLPNLKSSEIVYDKYGYFYKRNGSSAFEGLFNTETGEDDFQRIGIMRQWNYMNRTEFYNAECGMVNGSDGSFFPPGNPRDKPIEMYITRFCRTVKFDYSDDTEVEGIPSYRYVGTKKLMDTGDIDPDNWCFCSGECVPQGVLNISACVKNAPVFMSYPHFLHADPFYLRQVKGLQPDPKKHEFQIIVEPVTGFPVEVIGRFQTNFLLQSHENFRLYNNVPRVFFPMMWCQDRVRITPEFAKGLKLLLSIPTIGLCFSIGLVILGLILLAVSLMKIKLRDKKRENGHQVYSMVNTNPHDGQTVPRQTRIT